MTGWVDVVRWGRGVGKCGGPGVVGEWSGQVWRGVAGESGPSGHGCCQAQPGDWHQITASGVGCWMIADHLRPSVQASNQGLGHGDSGWTQVHD